MESSKITTSRLCSTNRLAFSITISATWTWRVAGSSKVLATTSPWTDRAISVTSSGRSSISNTIKGHSGWLAVIDWAICCNIIVFPALGGETIRPRCPLPIGETRSITRVVRSSVLPLPRCIISLSLANNGVRFSKMILFLVVSGESPFISLICSKAK